MGPFRSTNAFNKVVSGSTCCTAVDEAALLLQMVVSRCRTVVGLGIPSGGRVDNALHGRVGKSVFVDPSIMVAAPNKAELPVPH